MVYTLQEDPKKALEDFAKALPHGRTPKADFYLHKSVCHLQLREFVEAVGCLNEALKHYPNDKNLLKERSNANKLGGKFQDAIIDCTKLLENETDKNEVGILLINRAYCYGKLSEYKNAITDYIEALHISPDDTHCLFNRGICYEKICQYQSVKYINDLINNRQ